MRTSLEVVIPVGPRADTLPDCLKSLDRAVAHVSERVDTPVVVRLVGDRPSGADATYPYLLTDIIVCPGSVADRRNAGFRAGQAALVLFVDSDVYLVEDGVESLMEALRSKSCPLAAGATPLSPPRTAYGRAMAKMPYAFAFTFGFTPGELPWAPTTALLARREDLPEVPFVSLAPPRDCAEDVVLGTSLSLRRGAFAVSSAGRVVGRHDAREWDEPAGARERAWRFGRTEAEALSLFPDHSMPGPTLLPGIAWLVTAATWPLGWLLVATALALAMVGWRRGRISLDTAELDIRIRFFLSTRWHLLRAGVSGRRTILHPGQVLNATDRLATDSWKWLALWTGLVLMRAVLA